MLEGAIYSTADIAKTLRDLNKDYYGRSTWDTAYNRIAQNEQAALNQLNLDYYGQTQNLQKSYAESIAEAYAASQAQSRNVMASGLGTGYKEAMIASNQNALEKAYEQYRTNYMTNMSQAKSAYESGATKIAEQAATQTANIDAALQSQATNIQSYINAQYDYLQHLYTNYSELFSKPEWSRFVNEDGTLMSRSQLFDTKSATPFVENVGTDEQGQPILQLTQAGRDFYKQLQSYGDEHGVKYTLGDYLLEYNPELHEWLHSESADAGTSNYQQLYRDVLGVDTVSTFTYDDRALTKTGEEITTKDFAQSSGDTGVKFDENNLLVTDYIAENELDNFKSKTWYIGSTDYVPTTGMSMTDFENNKKNLLKGQAGISSKKKGQEYDKILTAYKNGTLKNGTVFDINYGKGEDYYIYLDGKIYALQDKKDRQTLLLKDFVTQLWDKDARGRVVNYNTSKIQNINE